MRRGAAPEPVEEEGAWDYDEEEEMLDLDEIAARLDRILERANRVDFQLAAFERKKQRGWNDTEIQPSMTISPVKTAQKKTVKSSPAAASKPAPKSTQKAAPKQKVATKAKAKPKPKPRKRVVGPQQKKNVTLSLIYDELLSLRKEVDSIAHTQAEMKLLLRR